MNRLSGPKIVSMFLGNSVLFGACLLAITRLMGITLDIEEILGTSLAAGALITAYNVFLLRMSFGKGR